MTNTAPETWRASSQRIRGTSPYLWGIVLQLHLDATLNLAVALTNQPASWTAGGVTFYPFPLSLEPIRTDRDGSLPTLQVTLSNRPRMLAPYFESPGCPAGIVGSTLRVYLTNDGDKSEVWTWDFEVAEAVLSNDSVTLTCEVPNFLQVPVPQERFVDTCRHHAFGGSACGYVINAFSGYSSCPRTYAACVLRGIDMQNRGLPKLQPTRFGGFLGVGRG